MLPLQELFNNQPFSQKNVFASWSPALCSVIKGLWVGDVLERQWPW